MDPKKWNNMARKWAQLVAIVLLQSCSNDMQAYHEDEGILLGFDTRKLLCMDNDPCACPGGILVEIGGVTYRSAKFPDDGGVVIDGTTVFPLNVNLLWEESETCPEDLIDIRHMTLR